MSIIRNEASRWLAKVVVSAAAWLLLLSQQIKAQEDPGGVPVQGCISCNEICTNGPGGLIFVRGTIFNCGFDVLTDVSASDTVGGVPVVVTVATNILLPGQATTYSASYSPANICVATVDNVTVRGTDAATGFGVTNFCTATCPPLPCLSVTTHCSTNVVMICSNTSGLITFSGTVSNCGTITLTNVTLNDDLLGTNITIGTLDSGATASYSVDFTAIVQLCGRSNIVNTATARGTSICDGSTTVTNKTFCFFSVVCAAPSLSVSKACASPIVTNVGSSITVTGQVCNTGNSDFQSVVVVDSQPGLPVNATNNLGSLAVGQCKPYSFTYTATSCDPNHDIVTATGNTACNSATATASADCFLCCPGVTIQTMVGCLRPGAICSGAISDYGLTATGIKGSTGDPLVDNPAFCYVIVVRNTGHDPLTNIVIHDDQLGALGNFPGPLAVGGTITISNLRTNWATTTTNSSTVMAQCGGAHANGALVSATASAVANIETAAISCQKLVSVNGGPLVQTSAPPCGVIASNINWYVMVTNSGTSILSGITIDEVGSPELLPCGQVSVNVTNVLAPGESVGPILICSTGFNNCIETNIENSIRVRARIGGNDCSINLGGSNTVAECQSTSSLTLCCNHLSITKACASGIVTNVGSTLTVTGLVCNLGGLDLTNVVIVDSQPGLPVGLTNVIALLPAGQCQGYSFSYMATSCDPNHDVVSVSGVDPAGGVVGPITASADCYLCCPGISMQTMVGCLLPGAVCSGSINDYKTNATGILGNTGNPAVDDPAFCYLFVIRNTGHDPLTNIVVHDDQFGTLGSFPGPLAVGGTITISNVRTNWASTTTNSTTVTARCGGAHANGAAVSATAAAVANIEPATVACQKFVSVNGGTPVPLFAPHCNLVATNITWYVTVTNTSGGAILHGITIQELGTGPDLLLCGPVSISVTNVLFPGEGTGLIPVCMSGFDSCVETNIDNSVLVRAMVAGISNGCSVNLGGSNIVAETQCSASLTLCCRPLRVGCRVTGSGRQDDPELCPENVRYITHGGQVGAPEGSANCVVTLDNSLGNPCIQGRWTHVRHGKAGGEGYFHARYYDTLDCTCVATNIDLTGLYSDGTCNPGTRGAGPEPSGAPGNKVVFTGIGDWTDANSHGAPLTVLFRVDSEDRSEPGGYHPGGAKAPADRYRIRIWILTAAEQAALTDPSNGLLAFRNAIAACHGLKYRDGVLSSQIANNCGGPGTILFPGGAPVRLPDIDDGGDLKNGNEQIHWGVSACK